MLQSFSDRIRTSSWLGYAIVIAISIPFALWGVQAYFGGADPSVAAEVNGEPIHSAELERMVSQRRQALRQQLGGELPESFSDRMLRNQVLEQLITREVLRQAAAEAGFQVGERMVAERIRQQQFFQRDGGFDRELYQRTLSQAGMSPSQYEAQVREGYRLEQLRSGVAGTAFVLTPEARRIARLQAEERRVSVLERSREAMAGAVTVEPEAVQAYYEDHRDAFRTPRRVRVAYLELDLAALRDQVDIPTEEVRAQYETTREQYRQAAERRASHILIEIPEDAGEAATEQAREQARELRRRIVEEGASFEAVAREHSDDPGSAEQGGDLGFISRGSMVEPFEQALFALDEAGDVSEPVRTTYGYHLIRLEEVREPKPQPFEAVREQVREDLATREAERLFYDRVEVLRNTTYENPGTLDVAADATGLEIQRSDWFSRDRGDGIAGAAAVREAAFSEPVLAERVNSDLVELGERRVAVLRVVDERPPEPRPLDAVRDEVRERVRAQRVEERLQAWSSEAVERLRAGEAAQALAADDGVSLRQPGWIARDGDDLDQRLRAAAFELPPPDAGESAYEVVSTGSGRAVVVVDGVRLPEVGADTVASGREQRRQRLSQAELQAWIAALKADADITRHSTPGQGGADSGG